MAYAKPQQRKKEEGERLRGEGDQIKFIDLRFERWQVVRFRKARRRQDVPRIACSRDEYSSEGALKNYSVKILCDINIQCDDMIEERRPDIVVIDEKDSLNHCGHCCAC